MMKTFYLGGKFKGDAARKLFLDGLCKQGLEQEEMWMTCERQTDLEDAVMWRVDAMRDTAAIARADLVVLVMDDPSYPYAATNSELGMAVGCLVATQHKHKQVVIVSPKDGDHSFKRNPFYHHPDVVHVETWGELLAWVKKEQAQRREAAHSSKAGQGGANAATKVVAGVM